MVAFNPPGSPRKLARNREVDTLSLEGDQESIKMALNAVFEAAVELDTFLAEERQSDENDSVADDDSFASEERRLHESELELRRALDCIDDSNNEDESDSVASEGCERLDNFSYESPESQVPMLQSVSPFGSPFSESSSTSTLCKEMGVSPAFECPTVARIHSPKESKKRQIRAYGLRPHVEESFDDIEAHEQLPSSPKGDDSAHAMANALFGRTEYSVRPLFSSEEYKRTVQGTVSVLLASGIVVADRTKHSQHVALLVLLLPALIAAIQARLPHQTDETTLAVVILGTHVAMSHLSMLHSF